MSEMQYTIPRSYHISPRNGNGKITTHVVPEGDIRMQNAKEPLTNEGFTLVFRGVKMSE